MNTYSYWEMGRNLGSGRIVSMLPIEPSSTASSLGSMSLGQAGIALSAVAQFGMYLEVRKMGVLRAAEFEERRHAWIIDITDQWIEEHQNAHGILRDVTEAVAKDCEKMWKKIYENDMVDIPQALLLRLKRMAEFIDFNFRVAAYANNYLVEASGSDEEWLLDEELSSESVVKQFLVEAADEPKRDFWGGLFKAATGVPLFLIPGIGPILGGGRIGYGLGDMIYTGRMSDSQFDRLEEKLPLLQFGIAATMLENATEQINYLLEQQKFRKPMRFLASESESNEISFLLDRAVPIKSRSMPKLKAVPLPPEFDES